MTLISILLFVTALIFLTTLIYATLELIINGGPEKRRKRVLEFGGITLFYILLSLNDVPSALAALSKGTGVFPVAPVFKSLAISWFFYRATVVQSSRAERARGERPLSKGIINTVMLLAMLFVLVGALIAVALQHPAPLGFLYHKSLTNSWLGLIGIFLSATVATYLTVFAILVYHPFRWLALAVFIAYMVLLSIVPPVQFQHVRDGEETTLADGLRTFFYSMLLVVITVPVSVMYWQRQLRERAAAREEKRLSSLVDQS